MSFFSLFIPLSLSLSFSQLYSAVAYATVHNHPFHILSSPVVLDSMKSSFWPVPLGFGHLRHSASIQHVPIQYHVCFGHWPTNLSVWLGPGPVLLSISYLYHWAKTKFLLGQVTAIQFWAKINDGFNSLAPRAIANAKDQHWAQRLHYGVYCTMHGSIVVDGGFESVRQGLFLDALTYTAVPL